MNRNFLLARTDVREMYYDYEIESNNNFILGNEFQLLVLRSGSSQTYKSCINKSLIKCIQKDSFGHTAVYLILRIYRKNIMCSKQK